MQNPKWHVRFAKLFHSLNLTPTTNIKPSTHCVHKLSSAVLITICFYFYQFHWSISSECALLTNHWSTLSRSPGGGEGGGGRTFDAAFWRQYNLVAQYCSSIHDLSTLFKKRTRILNTMELTHLSNCAILLIFEHLDVKTIVAAEKGT